MCEAGRLKFAILIDTGEYLCIHDRVP